MIFKPPAGDPEGRSPGRTQRESQGIRGRVEAAAKAHAPAPRGKGVVMLLLGLAVVAALIWDFTGRGAASRAVRESADDGERPVPREGPTGDHPEPPASPAAEFRIDVEVKEGATLSMTPYDAAAYVDSPEKDEPPGLRRRVLEALVEPAGDKGSRARIALETAAWLARGAGPDCTATLARLSLEAYPALEDDRTAHAAILFLSSLPDRGGDLGAVSLDDVILDARRPLHLRIAAARVRPAEGRPQAIEDLASSPATHPALREALRGP